MLTIKVKDAKIEFTFTEFFTKKHIHSQSFDFDDAEEIAMDLLKMIKDVRKKNAQKDRDEGSKSPQKRCF